MLTPSKKKFIEFMMSADVLRFGQFVTKSGRHTPYFVNTGNYKTGLQSSMLGSFYAEEPCKGLGTIPMTFIRAPYIASVSGSTQELATVDGNIVAARQGNQLVTAFHPELCDDLRVHQVFLNMIRDKN